SAPFHFDSTKELMDFMEGRSERVQPEYGRMGNPTVSAVEKRLAALEGAERAVLFSSGMAAITILFLTMLAKGDHLILTDDCYKKTRMFAFFLEKYGVETTIVAPCLDAVIAAVKPSTKFIFTEIPTNPYLRILDMKSLVAEAEKRNILTIADSTFATPVNLRPLDLGVDVVTHSATKYLGGHNDLLAGVLAGSSEIMSPVADLLEMMGAITDPNTAFLLDRGLKTLGIRVERHNSNGQLVAEFLESHPGVEKVFYPGLPSHPDHELAKSLMTGYGGVVTFLIKGGLEETLGFIDKTKIPYLSPSLGGVESIIDPVAPMSFWKMTREEREKLGMTDNLIRLATGIEDPEDIIADLKQAL
ncbi:MAG: aminotransferase class I/II-fold pyridoxal phosphate-dependent enzyme, partial [Acidobacteriota bacterium]